jgi:hypothetical protein
MTTYVKLSKEKNTRTEVMNTTPSSSHQLKKVVLAYVAHILELFYANKFQVYDSFSCKRCDSFQSSFCTSYLHSYLLEIKYAQSVNFQAQC